MVWGTSRNLKINRAATAWLIRQFIDGEAEFVFVSAGDVADEATRRGGVGFHAPRTRYPARDSEGRTLFEVLVDERCSDNETLRVMALLVRDADIRQPEDRKPRGCG
jgi:hypothetical protein